jgi:hypothetical protein
MDDNPYSSPESSGAGQKLSDGIKDRMVAYSSVAYLAVLLVVCLLFIEGGGQPTPQHFVAVFLLATPPLGAIHWILWKRFWQQ